MLAKPCFFAVVGRDLVLAIAAQSRPRLESRSVAAGDSPMPQRECATSGRYAFE